LLFSSTFTSSFYSPWLVISFPVLKSLLASFKKFDFDSPRSKTSTSYYKSPNVRIFLVILGRFLAVLGISYYSFSGDFDSSSGFD
jgi:hypothetical protein